MISGLYDTLYFPLLRKKAHVKYPDKGKKLIKPKIILNRLIMVQQIHNSSKHE